MTLYEQIEEKHGLEAMRDIWIEELNELAVALAHHKRGKCNSAQLQDEIADVTICLEQIRELLPSSIVDGIIYSKKAMLPRKLGLK